MKTKVFTPYEWFLILGILFSNIIYSVLSGELDILGSVASITGLLCVVLVAKGNILNYLFGLINVSLYAYISYTVQLYGDAALNALYYVPMQFIGWWQWRKRGSVDSSQVKARRLGSAQRLLLATACAVAVVAVGYVLRYFGDPHPFKDSATTVLSIIAQALMALAFMEQWFLWIITNVISVVMWVMCAFEGEPYAGFMVIMWVFYLLNSINGLRIWNKLSQMASA